MQETMTNARVLSGRGLVHRKLDARQRACVAANAAQGETKIDWTVTQLVAALKVSRAYVDLARTFSPEKRQAIIDGRDGTSFAALRRSEMHQPALPAPKRRIVVNGKSIDDATLLQVVRSAGVERTLQAAMAVEAAQ